MGMLLHGTNKPKLAKELTKQALSTDFKGGLGFPHQFDKWLNDFVVYWKNKDSRRLYSTGAGWPITADVDFASSYNPRIMNWAGGLSFLNSKNPTTSFDWREHIKEFRIPTVSHEIGQWCVYPDLKEIEKYTGVLKAKNFEIFKETLIANNMGHLADSFLLASGKLQALCYKSEIEAALRTPGFGGFQLLDLHDFPGQGSAIVGVLNAFWDEKGYITPKEYSAFCNAVVPLARLPKMIFTNNEELVADIEIANFGSSELKNTIPVWKLVDAKKTIIANGELTKQTIPIGNGIQLGKIEQSLKTITTAQKLRLLVSVGDYENSWDIWVYPSKLDDLKNEVFVTQTFDKKAIELLNNGGKILLTIKKGSIKPEHGGNIAIGFSSIFWDTAWFLGADPSTLGILCNPNHPALAEFPSEYYSNYQWQYAMANCNAINLAALKVPVEPIVRIIDDWFTNRKLALIFEAQIGKGKLLICGADLLRGDNRPEPRQLKYSLLKYMETDKFNPVAILQPNDINSLFK